MSLEESYRILGLREGASSEERFRVYRELRDRLTGKRENAPTAGLEIKYEQALVRIDQAIVISRDRYTSWIALRSFTPSRIGFWNAFLPEINPIPPARLLITAVVIAS